MASRDFRDLFAEFNAVGVEFLVVGAHALAIYGHVRATKDLDVWVRPSPDNAQRVLRALASFGAPTENVSIDDFSAAGLTYQIGVEPFRIDVLTAIDGVVFEEAWSRRSSASIDDQHVHVISRADLIRNKKTSGRLQDLADVEALERHG